MQMILGTSELFKQIHAKAGSNAAFKSVAEGSDVDAEPAQLTNHALSITLKAYSAALSMCRCPAGSFPP